MCNLSDYADMATIAASVLGVGALIFGGVQLMHSAKVAEGQFLLELEKMVTSHDDVHLKLRPGGAWTEGQSPATAEEWAKLEDYMGFFEHCELLIQDGSLSEKRFANIFDYRLRNILANKAICAAKLMSNERPSWELFIALCKRFGLQC